MRTIRILLAAAALALPLLSGVTGSKADEPGTRMKAVHHVRMHRHFYPAVHSGYYWYQWGERAGGTRCCWFGSAFTGVVPPPSWWWSGLVSW